jgi:hypothetical protein
MTLLALGAEFFHVDVWTDVTKLIVAFHRFVNAPKSGSSKVTGLCFSMLGPQKLFATIQEPT